MDPKIQSKDLDFFYGNKQVLKRINLGVKEHLYYAPDVGLVKSHNYQGDEEILELECFWP